MKILTAKEYADKKSEFLRKSGDWTVETSSMDQYGKYVKVYVGSNGNVLTEVLRPVWETVEVEVKGVKVKVDIKLFESEMFTNREADSVFTYEKY